MTTRRDEDEQRRKSLQAKLRETEDPDERRGIIKELRTYFDRTTRLTDDPGGYKGRNPQFGKWESNG